MKRWFHHYKTNAEDKTQNEIKNTPESTANHFINQLKKSNDFIYFYNQQSITKFHIYYYGTLVDTEIIHRDILPYINAKEFQSLEELQEAVPIDNMFVTSDHSKVQNNLLK